jgi:hypothetical protein
MHSPLTVDQSSADAVHPGKVKPSGREGSGLVGREVFPDLVVRRIHVDGSLEQSAFIAAGGLDLGDFRRAGGEIKYPDGLGVHTFGKDLARANIAMICDGGCEGSDPQATGDSASGSVSSPPDSSC